jgi:hypothetical protein
MKSAVAPPGDSLGRAQVSNALAAGTSEGTIIATIMTVRVAMKTLRPMDIERGMPIRLPADMVVAPVSTPKRMSGVASRGLSSQAPPANPNMVATRARPAARGAPSR